MNKTLVIVVGAAVFLMIGVTLMSLTSTSLSILGQSQESISSRCSVQIQQFNSGVLDRDDVSRECINHIEDDESRNRAIAEIAGVPIQD